jgi:hypothetical protein
MKSPLRPRRPGAGRKAAIDVGFVALSLGTDQMEKTCREIACLLEGLRKCGTKVRRILRYHSSVLKQLPRFVREEISSRPSGRTARVRGRHRNR